MLQNLVTYQLALDLYRSVERLHCPSHLREQLLRAASSVALNLAEGSGRGTAADQRRCYRVALGSLRETQAVLDLCARDRADLAASCDKLGAHIYRLCHPKPS